KVIDSFVERNNAGDSTDIEYIDNRTKRFIQNYCNFKYKHQIYSESRQEIRPENDTNGASRDKKYMKIMNLTLCKSLKDWNELMISRIKSKKEDILMRNKFSSMIFDAMKSKSIILHNGIIDAMILYQNLFEDLPPTYLEFKKAINELGIQYFDTKLIASHTPNFREKNSGSLNDLSTDFPIEFEFATRNETGELDPNVQLEYLDENNLHNAGYDSFLTGSLYITFLEKFPEYCKQSANKLYISSLTDNFIDLKQMNTSLTNDDYKDCLIIYPNEISTIQELKQKLPVKQMYGEKVCLFYEDECEKQLYIDLLQDMNVEFKSLSAIIKN
ncbi:MAG: Poly(A)-specific ribonuclease pnldc1, partial [Marteilia pararefringens]